MTMKDQINSLLKEKERLEAMLKQSEKTLEEVLLELAKNQNNQEPMDLNIEPKNSKLTNLDIQANYLSINRNMYNNQSNIKFNDKISHIANHNYLRNNLNNKGYEKHAYQCELCDFSTSKPSGVSSHRTKVHGCKYINKHGEKCKNILCKIHEILYDPRNSNNSKKAKLYQCEYCSFSTNSPNGTAIHKGMIHRCKYKDDDDNQCESFNCQKHCQKYIFRCI